MHFKAENLRIPKHPRLLFLAQHLGVLRPSKTRCHFLWDTLYIVHLYARSLLAVLAAILPAILFQFVSNRLIYMYLSLSRHFCSQA